MDCYLITWKYIVDMMNTRYGIAPDSTEPFTMREIETYVDNVWEDFYLEQVRSEIRRREEEYQNELRKREEKLMKPKSDKNEEETCTANG